MKEEFSRFKEGFVPMSRRAEGYEVLLRGGVCVPASCYASHLRSTPDYVLCCYPMRDYAYNRPTCFDREERDSRGRPYMRSWGGFCVWASDPLKAYRVYGVDGDTLYLKYGPGYYKSTGMRPPVPDRVGVRRKLGLLPAQEKNKDEKTRTKIC